MHMIVVRKDRRIAQRRSSARGQVSKKRIILKERMLREGVGVCGRTNGTSGGQWRGGQKQRIAVICIVVVDDIIVIGVNGRVIDVRELAVAGIHVVIIGREKTGVVVVQRRKQIQIVVRDVVAHIATLSKKLVHSGGIQRWVDLNTGMRSRLRHFVGNLRLHVIVGVVQVHLVCASRNRRIRLWLGRKGTSKSNMVDCCLVQALERLLGSHQLCIEDDCIPSNADFRSIQWHMAAYHSIANFTERGTYLVQHIFVHVHDDVGSEMKSEFVPHMVRLLRSLGVGAINNESSTHKFDVVKLLDRSSSTLIVLILHKAMHEAFAT